MRITTESHALRMRQRAKAVSKANLRKAARRSAKAQRKRTRLSVANCLPKPPGQEVPQRVDKAALKTTTMGVWHTAFVAAWSLISRKRRGRRGETDTIAVILLWIILMVLGLIGGTMKDELREVKGLMRQIAVYAAEKP